jgi:hypothetical protein
MATVLKGYITEQRRSVVNFLCVQKDSMQRIFIKKCFLFMVESVFFTKSSSELGGKHFSDDEEVETEVRNWPRQQSKDFYAAGFDALVKQWDKCINVGGGYVEKQMFFSSTSIICSTFYIHLQPIY